MYQFGLHLQEVEEMQPFFEIAAAPYPEKAEDEVVIIAEINDRKFTNLTLEKYSRNKVGKYLFRELAAARATSIVPSLHFYFVAGNDALDVSCDKFFNKLERCLDNNKDIYEKYFDTGAVNAEIRKNLKSFVQEKISEKKNYLFTLQIDQKWLGEIAEIKKILEDTCYNKYFQDGKGELFLGRNKTCAVTYKQNVPEVWGRIDTLGFTVNDISFSRNGFIAKNSYKMFPVSPDAVKVLEGTFRALDKRLSFTFSTLKFFVVPHFITLGDDLVKKKNIIRTFVRKLTETDKPGFAPLANAIINSEKIFSKILEDPELGANSVYYDIFFYEEKQAQFSIKLHVSDILPSRFRSILDAKNRVTAFYLPITYKEFKDGKSFSFSPTFNNIKAYFSIKKEKEVFIEPYFFKIIEAVFYKNKLNEEQILRAFMQKIVPAFKNVSNNGYAFPEHVKHTFCIHQFFQQIQLFENMEYSDNSTLTLSSFEFIKQHEMFFNSRLHKAAFLLGCAVEVLLGSQRSNLNGNEPFAKRLNNLSIDYKELQRIGTELLSKVKQYAEAKKLYDGQYIHEMFVEFDKLMMNGDDPNLSKTQVSYAFSVGLVMEKEFTKLRIAERIKKRNQSITEIQEA